MGSVTATSAVANFTPPTPAPTGYIAVYNTTSPVFSGNPVNGGGTVPTSGILNGTNGTICGTAVAPATTMNLTLPTGNSNYTITIFSYDNTGCTGGPIYSPVPVSGNA